MASKPTISPERSFCPDSGGLSTGTLGCSTANSPSRTSKFTRTTSGPRNSATSSSATTGNPSSTITSQSIPPTSTSSTFSDVSSPTSTESDNSSSGVPTSSPSSLDRSSTLAPLSSTITSTSSYLGSNGTNTVISLPSTPTPSLSAPTTTQSPSIPNVQDMTGAAKPGSSTASVQTSASAQSNSVASGAAHTSSSTHSDHTGAIVGAVIGGLAFLLLTTVATILLRRRMRARRTAPSAEFMGRARGPTPRPGGLGLGRTAGTTTPSGHRLLSPACQNTLGDDDDDRPPAFTPGVYADPVMEKVQVAAAMREQYRPRDSYYGGAQADYKEGTSETGHEGESTQVGTEEGYGSVGDEKSGYYTWAM